MSATQSVNKPVHSIRFGAIKASIWKNPTQSGHWFNVTFVRSYKDGERWRDSSSFGVDDLLTLSKLMDLSHTWIHQQLAATAKQLRAGGEITNVPGADSAG